MDLHTLHRLDVKHPQCRTCYPTPWLLIDPNGILDGILWGQPDDPDDAGRKFLLSKRAWEKAKVEGWVCRRGVDPDEHKRMPNAWDAQEQTLSTTDSPSRKGQRRAPAASQGAVSAGG